MGYRPQKLIGTDNENLNLSRKIKELKDLLFQKETLLSALYESAFTLKLALARVQNETRNNEMINEMRTLYEAKVNEALALRAEIQELKKSINYKEDKLCEELSKSIFEEQPNNN